MKKILKIIIKRILTKKTFILIKNFKLFLDALGRLRLSNHVSHFKDIHEIVLWQNWLIKNQENLSILLHPELSKNFNQADRIRSFEYKIYSQNGEDGILLYLFSKIGIENNNYVNIGAGGLSSNSANLVNNYNWKGLEIDGSSLSLTKCKKLFKDKNLKENHVTFMKEWVTKENINDIIKKWLCSEKNVDLLSIDIDGNDYWVWSSITTINPRIVLIEYNAFFGYKKGITVKYDPMFDRYKKHHSGWYIGASLKALSKLGKSKGYSLVCCDSNGVNAFFVRDDLLKNINELNEIEVTTAYYPHFQSETQLKKEDLDFILKEMKFTSI
jgi:hypothetical protein